MIKQIIHLCFLYSIIIITFAVNQKTGEQTMDRLSSFWNFLGKHKYLITILVFIVIVGFLDENSILYRIELAHEEANLRSEIEKYREEYRESTKRLDELNVDSNSIERIAREKYMMKKPNEDIFVFAEDME